MPVYFTKEHEWIRVEGDTATIGISDHAQEQLGDIVFAEVPEAGRRVSKGQEAAVVESVKAASDVYAPVSGEVVEGNQAVADDPSLVNSDPEGQGWFQWVLPTGQGGRVPRPAVRERTRAAALEAARRRFAPVAAAMVKAARFLSPQATEAQLAPQEAQIVPTTLGLQIIYVPGASHRHLLVVVDGSESHYRATWDQ